MAAVSTDAAARSAGHCRLQANGLPASTVLTTLIHASDQRCTWRGRDEARDVIIKLAQASFADVISQECSFLRELAEGEASVSFPRCLAVCTPDGRNTGPTSCGEVAYNVQTALAGDTLDEVARKPDQESARLVRAAGAGLRTLDWLWKRGVAHRDLSGSNLLFDEPTASLRLCDFDSAIWLDRCDREACVPSHLLPAPPWHRGMQPITYNVPPELFATAAKSAVARDRAPMGQPWHSRELGFAFDAWGLGMALLQKLDCPRTTVQRLWEHAASGRTAPRWAHDGADAAAGWAEACDLGDYLGPSVPLQESMLPPGEWANADHRWARQPAATTDVLQPDASGLCEPYCAEPCAALNGDVARECGGCGASYACRPGGTGFPGAVVGAAAAASVATRGRCMDLPHSLRWLLGRLTAADPAMRGPPAALLAAFERLVRLEAGTLEDECAASNVNAAADE